MYVGYTRPQLTFLALHSWQQQCKIQEFRNKFRFKKIFYRNTLIILTESYYRKKPGVNVIQLNIELFERILNLSILKMTKICFKVFSKLTDYNCIFRNENARCLLDTLIKLYSLDENVAFSVDLNLYK